MRKFLVILILLFYYSAQAQTQEQEKPGFYLLQFTDLPDTLSINGKIISDPENGKRYPVNPGKYVFKASLDCYYPIEKELEIKSGFQRPLTLNFDRLNTQEYSDYRTFTYINGFYNAIGLTMSAIIPESRPFGLPLFLLGVAEQVYSNIRMRRHFDPCSRVYSGPEYKAPDWTFEAGITTSALGEALLEGEFQSSVLFDFPVSDVRLRYDNTLELRINRSYGIHFGLQKYILSYFSVAFSTEYFPMANAEITLEDSQPFYKAGSKQTKSAQHPHFVLNFDILGTLYTSINQRLSLLFGAYYSNPLRGSLIFPVTVPDNAMFQGKTAEQTIEYEYTASGVKAGIQFTYLLNDMYSMFFKSHFYQPYVLSSGEFEARDFFYHLNAGIGISF